MKSIFIVLAALIIIPGCSSPEKVNRTKPHIVATTSMLYDALINIGKDSITAEAIMGPGVDPHLYKATQGDLAKFKNADMIVFNGIQLEGKMSDILKKLGMQKPVVAAAEAIPKEMLLSAVGYQDAYDPHVWFDINRWKIAVEEIAKALTTEDSVNAAYYRNNANIYLNQLTELDSFVRQELEKIPTSQRILVTAHDAFGYFGDSYGIQVKGLQGISTVADFGLKDIAEIIDLIIENNIKAIFVETSVSEKSINAVITGCQEKGHNVKVGGYLYSDAMGALGTEEGTYLGMFKKNVKTIVESLR